MTYPSKVTRPALAPGQWMSHGTLELSNFDQTRRFFTEVLGIETVRHAAGGMFATKGVYMTIACVGTPQINVNQGFDNRWGLEVGSREAVDAAYARVAAVQQDWEISELLPPAQRTPFYSFCLRDVNGNWWEIQDAGAEIYDELFRQGDCTDASTAPCAPRDSTSP